MIQTNAQILQGNSLEVLKTLPSESVQTCVTSPPYFGLRDYGTANWEGGLEDCAHVKNNGCSEKSTLGLAKGLSSNLSALRHGKSATVPYQNECGKCGAKRIDNQIGLEKTPTEYVQSLVDVFDEVWRVLRPDGTLWLNLGDSYANDGKWGGNSGGKHAAGLHGSTGIGRQKVSTGLKPKDLMMIPHRTAIALQDAGWYVRQDIIWSKPNPMPESVTDRCTKSHEYIFLLTKSDRYYFDNQAIKEPATENNWSARLMRESLKSAPTEKVNGIRTRSTFGNRNGELEGLHSGKEYIFDGKRNKRSVWTVNTKPYSEAHFATFPEKLIEPCILAGSREGDTVLDPFNGAATTGVVSLKYKRNYIGIELNPDYIAISEKRLNALQVKLF